MTPEFIEQLKKVAKRKCWVDQMNESSCGVDDFAGGNIDDAYSGGCSDGESLLARDVLKELGISYT